MYKKIMEHIKNANNIYICTHVGPDGDAIGSAMALFLALKDMGKEVKVCMGKYSDRFSFLKELKDTVETINEDAIDLLICTDASAYNRFSIPAEDFSKAKEVICIDHHNFNEIETDLKVVDNTSPATCELIYDFFKENNINITPKIASYLYLGLMTDTGSFNYDRTTAKTYRIAADLVEKGADFVTICRNINDTCKEEKLKLLSYVIDNMESYYNGKFRFAFVPKEVAEKLNIDKEDLEGMANYLRMIEGTEIAAYMYIKDLEKNIYKVSMRSPESADCSLIARKFNGGGHVHAAGFDTNNVEQDKQKLIQYVGEVLNGENNRDS